MSPSFSSSSGPLSPQLSTGDSIRDKCIELLAAALRTNGEDVVRLPHWQLNKTAAAVLTQSHTHTHTTCTNKFLHVLRSGSDLGDSYVLFPISQMTTKSLEQTATAWQQKLKIISFDSLQCSFSFSWFDLICSSFSDDWCWQSTAMCSVFVSVYCMNQYEECYWSSRWKFLFLFSMTGVSQCSTRGGPYCTCTLILESNLVLFASEHPGPRPVLNGFKWLLVDATKD